MANGCRVVGKQLVLFQLLEDIQNRLLSVASIGNKRTVARQATSYVAKLEAICIHAEAC